MNAFFPLLAQTTKYRLLDFDFPPILPESLNWPSQPFFALGILILSFVIGSLFANSIRLKDYGWKIGLILAAFFLSLFVVLFGEYKLGVDLKGGVILVYEIDEKETAALNPQGRSDQWSMNELIRVISRRLNPDGLKEIVVRPFGPKQVEIVVPEVDPVEIERIKESLATGGVLRFMIVASENQEPELYELARAQAERPGDRLDRLVMDASGEQKGYWAKLGREERNLPTDPPGAFRELDSLRGLIRDADTGKIIELTPQQRNLYMGNSDAFQSYLEQRGTREVDVLLVYDAAYDIRGEDLSFVGKGRDDRLRPKINFSTKGEGIFKMGALTQLNIERKLAIVFDNELLSAPVIRSKISESGEITGQFTEEEVDFIVGILRSGSMPVVMQKKPISENQIGSILGRDTIVKGSWSVVLALAFVLVFIGVYYRFAGLVACFALTLNMLLTIGFMIILRAPLTLPGLAGLVLTVGMSIDANVLIFERIREELARGAAFRMALRNGFDRALSAIIDGNVTTFLTALVLYAIGTDQVRGFGITLMLGNVTSMFTAIFVSRVILDVVERTRWMKTLKMFQLITSPNIDWVKWLVPASVVSTILILIGLGATVARGRGMFDIDLAGGTSVAFVLKDSTPVAEARQKLDAVFSKVVDERTKGRVDYNAYEMSLQGEKPEAVYKVDSALGDIDLLKKHVREAFRRPDGKDGIKTYQMEIAQVAELPPETPVPPATIGAPATNGSQPQGATSDTPAEPAEPVEEAKPAAKAGAEEKPTEAKPKAADDADGESADDSEECSEECQEEQAEEEPEAPTPAKAKAASSEDAAEKSAEEKATKAESAQEKSAEAPPAAAPPTAEEPATPATPPADRPSVSALGDPPVAAPIVFTKAILKFPTSPIGGEALRERIASAAKASINQDVASEVYNAGWNKTDNSTFSQWEVTLPLPEEQARTVLEATKDRLESDVVWQTASQIGGQVSVDTRWKAITALAFCIVIIIAYLWFRFQKAVWGIAAIVAVVHDALIMLGALAVSYWLAGPLGFLGIEEFKISLPIVAAFLTLIGYSVNDTIVIFDRLREMRGKSPDITRKMLNDAVNQTLSRTILTGGLVLIVVTVLYIWGGPGIHGFAFALVVGVISGTYSTVFIAAPLVLWLMGKQSAQPARVAAREDRGPPDRGGGAGVLPKPSRSV